MHQQDLDSLRSQIDSLNLEILRLINERASVVEEIGKIKEKQGVNRYDPLRERHMLDLIKENNNGPLNQMTVDYIFKQIFKTALKQLEAEKKKELLVSRKEKSEDTVINVNGELIGT
ncbi:MAG: chorismate mutase, partial [Solibacillus isronensis]